MRIVGIDPGFAIVGVGFVEFNANKFRTIEQGAIMTPAGMDFNERLLQIYDELSRLLQKHKPQYAAVEKLFFQNNQKT
ncbi:MAG: crossover junction endodeoxyribonuclease RuvC, partial [Clostridia bacterium]